jgi:ABC-type multidrug transport system ATPase subunit
MNEDVNPSATWAIEVEGLVKSFGSSRALSGVDIRVKKGDRLTIFGPNGAGKTTLIKLLSTLAKPSGGSARVEGLDISSEPVNVRRRLGVVTHPTFLYNDLTVFENLRFYGKMYRVPNLELRISEVISQVQLDARIYDRVGTLSHGMQKRAAIARAVLHSPSVLLLDEPESGLDPAAAVMMRGILEALDSGDRTVVMTTHNIERGLELADQVAILREGRVVYQEAKKDIDTETFSEIYERYTS